MWSIIGQQNHVRALERALATGHLAHAYLLVGPLHIGKGTLALNLAQAVNCEGNATGQGEATGPCGACRSCRRITARSHADVVTLRVEEAEGRKEMRLEQVKDVQRLAFLKPYEGRHRVFILDGAEHLNEEAANALLKLVEEPPPQVLLLLLVTDELRLPGTLRSRCHRMELRPLPEEELASALESGRSVPPERARLLARLARGCPGWAVQALEQPSLLERRERELERLAALTSASLEERFSYAGELAGIFPRNRSGVREALDFWAGWWRDMLLVQQGLHQAVTNLDQEERLRSLAGQCTRSQVVGALRAILRTAEFLDLNVNPRLALEQMMLSLPQLADPGRAGKGASQ